MTELRATPIARLRRHYAVTDSGCWEWTAYRDRDGYGTFSIDNAKWLAHRAAYTLLCGPIPAGLELDHTCRNRACVNPEHLEPVTRQENILRSDAMAAINARKTHCKRDHEFTDENTYRWNGVRICRTCRRQRDERKRGAA